MLLSRCVVWGSKKFKFIKVEEASGLLSQLGIETPSLYDVIYNDQFFKDFSLQF